MSAFLPFAQPIIASEIAATMVATVMTIEGNVIPDCEAAITAPEIAPKMPNTVVNVSFKFFIFLVI